MASKKYVTNSTMELASSDISLQEKECWAKRTSLEKALVAIVVLVVIVVVILAVVLGLKVAEYEMKEQRKEDKKEETREEVCMTPECVTAAAQFHANIDFNVNPCDDFYSFACGKWRKNTVIPEDQQSMNKFVILIERVEIILKYLLEEENMSNDPEAVKKVKRLYKSCMNETLIDDRGISVAFDMLQKLGGWPVIGTSSGGNWIESNFDLSAMLVTSRIYGSLPIINLFVDSDMKNSSIRIIFLDQPGFGMPGRDYYLRGRNDTMVLAYEKLFILVAMAFGANESVATQDARDVVELETEIANISVPAEQRRDIESLYNLMTIRELTKNFTDSSTLKFSWSRYVMDIMKMDGVNITLSEDARTLVMVPSYFEKIIPVLEKYSRRTIANYIVWRFIFSKLSNLGKNFQELLSDYNKVISGTSAISARWRRCISYANNVAVMGMAVGRLFVDETFDSQAKSDMLELIRYIKTSFDDILKELDWMDDETRRVAKEKADDIADKIGYEDSILNNTALDKMYENLEISEDHYFENVLNVLQDSTVKGLKLLNLPVNKSVWTTPPAEVNAYYNWFTNTMMFPAGILQSPFYNKNHPKSMNFGGIGIVIGHEITHGFDDQGRQFDKDGNLNQWWNVAVIDNFRDKASCMINQYGSYVVPEADMKINGINTQGENIADNGGVKQSFRAYRNWVKARGKDEPKLPGLNFTNNQLFFINYGNLWCSNMRKENAMIRILTGVHSPPQFRIIGPLQNSADFAREFNCPVGSFMNPAKKCYVW